MTFKKVWCVHMEVDGAPGPFGALLSLKLAKSDALILHDPKVCKLSRQMFYINSIISKKEIE